MLQYHATLLVGYIMNKSLGIIHFGYLLASHQERNSRPGVFFLLHNIQCHYASCLLLTSSSVSSFRAAHLFPSPSQSYHAYTLSILEPEMKHVFLHQYMQKYDSDQDLNFAYLQGVFFGQPDFEASFSLRVL